MMTQCLQMLFLLRGIAMRSWGTRMVPLTCFPSLFLPRARFVFSLPVCQSHSLPPAFIGAARSCIHHAQVTSDLGMSKLAGGAPRKEHLKVQEKRKEAEEERVSREKALMSQPQLSTKTQKMAQSFDPWQAVPVVRISPRIRVRRHTNKCCMMPLALLRARGSHQNDRMEAQHTTQRSICSDLQPPR